MSERFDPHAVIDALASEVVIMRKGERAIVQSFERMPIAEVSATYRALEGKRAVTRFGRERAIVHRAAVAVLSETFERIARGMSRERAIDRVAMLTAHTEDAAAQLRAEVTARVHGLTLERASA